jgi:hypothetical protein
MSGDRQDEAATTGLTRRGKAIYETNPSVVGKRFPTRVIASKPTRDGSAYMIAADTGEVLREGSFGFVEEKEVDSATFVKVYLAGIKQYGQLSKSGATIFEIVYQEISGLSGKDKDTVVLNLYIAQKHHPDLTRRTYERGMNELLEKAFLFRSIAADVYFVNVNFMFNGDRMVVVKAYRRSGSTLQHELPFDNKQVTRQEPAD